MADYKHIYVEEDLAEGAVIKLDRERMHYLSRVLRLQDGAALALFNGRDGLWQAQLDMLGRQKAVLKLILQMEGQPDFSVVPRAQLLFAPIKKHRQEILIEKSVELGVAALCPILTEHTDRVIWKKERIEAMIIKAAEQCGRLDLPEIVEPLGLEAVLAAWPDEQNLYFCAESGAAVPLLAQLMSDKKEGRLTAQSGFIIGPEGGFSAAEMAQLRGKENVRPVSLGQHILRAETAGIAVLSLWQAVCGGWADERI